MFKHRKELPQRLEEATLGQKQLKESGMGQAMKRKPTLSPIEQQQMIVLRQSALGDNLTDCRDEPQWPQRSGLFLTNAC